MDRTFVFQDLFSKWIELTLLKAANSETILSSFLELVVTRWGTPQVLHTDSETEFNNKAVRELAAAFDIHRSFNPLYQPQANTFERTNRMLKTRFGPLLNRTIATGIVVEAIAPNVYKLASQECRLAGRS